MLRVTLGEVPVGLIERRAGGHTVFRFLDAYLTMVHRPVLGRWFEDRLSPSFEYGDRGSLLPPFFQNYLPEKDGLLRRLLAEKAGVKPHHELPLLAALGEDLPGAIIVRPDEATEPSDDAPPTPDASRFKFSLAGLQLKFPIAERGVRLVVPVKGEGSRWIAKLPDPRYAGLPETEHAMLAWAAASGIVVPEHRIVPLGDIEGLPPNVGTTGANALLVRRFDRGDAGLRIHQEDFAQVLDVRPGPDDKYEASYDTVAKIVREVCGEADYEELLRRLVFVVLSGNADAHLKNWSLVYEDRQRARLSPAYDLVCTVAFAPDRHLALRLAGREKKVFEEVDAAHFQRLAARIGASPERATAVLQETAERAREAWKRLDSAAPLPGPIRDAVNRHLATLRI